MVHFLADTEGIQREGVIAVAVVTASLEYMMAHFLLCTKSWARYGSIWCMIRQGRRLRSWKNYQRWWYQDGIDLEFTRLASGVVEATLEEEAEERGGVGNGDRGSKLMWMGGSSK